MVHKRLKLGTTWLSVMGMGAAVVLMVLWLQTRGGLASTQAQLVTSQQGLGSMQAELFTSQQALASTRAELVTSQQRLESTETQLVTSQQRLASTQSQYQGLQSEHQTLQTQYANLQKEVGGVETVRQQRQSLLDSISSLQRDIGRYQEQRKALIPATSGRTFVCTGSMDPKVTCMDSATFLDHPRPDEIVVGAVISYTPTQDCKTYAVGDSENVSHRVTMISTKDGEYLFRTRGDNNPFDDGCWIPFPKVNGMMTILHKGFNAGMQRLLDQIWPLEHRGDQLSTDLVTLGYSIDSLRGQYQKALADYNAQYQRYCGGVPTGQTCSLPAAAYNIANPLYEQANQLGWSLDAMVNTYNSWLADERALRDQVRTLRNQLETLRCTKLYACDPYRIK